LEEGAGRSATPIESMPGVSRLTIEAACSKVGEAMELGVSSFALFPRVPDTRKTSDAREAFDAKNLACRALKTMRDKFPEACLIADVALDPYSSKGHDGLVGSGPHGGPEVLNDETVAALCKQAVVQAEAGADVIAPSDMMDGRVGAIRHALDSAGFEHVVILSYTAKYASAFYGPFRDALDSAPVSDPTIPRDKRGYQLDPANIRQALREATLDIQEGADILLVKPAILYLDVIRELRANCDLPIAAYHVSGEYAMLRAAAERGWLDYEKCLNEALLAIARAGADIILTYGALDFAKQVRRGVGHG
jgi:porphobilinogen synthase